MYVDSSTIRQGNKTYTRHLLRESYREDKKVRHRTIANLSHCVRRNPYRAREIAQSRQDKLDSLNHAITLQNTYLQEHPKASGIVALRKITAKANKLHLSGWVTPAIDDRRVISISTDEEVLATTAKLDGCYALKTDLPKEIAAKEAIHHRYKDLALVEMAFRTSKTVELEVRPINVRLASRTRGHVFVVMLAYRIVQELAHMWRALDLTVEEGIKELATLCLMEIEISGVGKVNQIPEPRASIKRLLDAAQVTLPTTLPWKGINVTTRKKLADRR